MKFLNMALEIKSTYATGWSNKGFVLMSVSKYDEALTCFYLALSIESKHRDALIGIHIAMEGLAKKKLMEDKTSCDLHLTLVSGECYSVHKDVMSVRCPKLIQLSLKNQKLPYRKEIFDSFLLFLYCGDIPNWSEEDIENMLDFLVCVNSLIESSPYL
eukprot:TRINITY_DN2574_c0_g1_i1.p1 TRINITY_DN2574_c0_g1~~TRINITY_DN2574_c0_g1_i1.p1  ORF type:complete len:158 (+),score=12.90 TRINITY_DN2574_c0_g1_i1:231-704(+)